MRRSSNVLHNSHYRGSNIAVIIMLWPVWFFLFFMIIAGLK